MTDLTTSEKIDWMENDMVNKRNYSDIFKRITRYSIKPAGIILDRHAPPLTGEPKVDPNGEWMKCDQLNNIIHAGGLLEFSPELKELMLDGQAQRGLMRDIGNLGYESFDQVMEILKNNRHQLLDEREFNLWDGGYKSEKETIQPRDLGKVKAFSFHEACIKLRDQRKDRWDEVWSYHKHSNYWDRNCCKVYENEAAAREAFGK